MPFIILPVLLLLVISIAFWFYLGSKFDIHIKRNTLSKKIFGLKPEEIVIKIKNLGKIKGWYFPVNNNKPLIILTHGYSTTKAGKESALPYICFLKKHGYPCFTYDNRSFGESDGKEIRLGLTEWADLALITRLLKTRPENINRKVGFMGGSMGSCTVILCQGLTQLADFIICWTPYRSIRELFKFQIKKMGAINIFYPLLKIITTIKFGFKSRQLSAENQIKKIFTPIIMIGAKNDSVVNFKDTKELFDLCPSKNKYYYSMNTDHDIYAEKPALFEEKVIRFLKRQAV